MFRVGKLSSAQKARLQHADKSHNNRFSKFQESNAARSGSSQVRNERTGFDCLGDPSKTAVVCTKPSGSGALEMFINVVARDEEGKVPDEAYSYRFVTPPGVLMDVYGLYGLGRSATSDSHEPYYRRRFRCFLGFGVRTYDDKEEFAGIDTKYLVSNYHRRRWNKVVALSDEVSDDDDDDDDGGGGSKKTSLELNDLVTEFYLRCVNSESMVCEEMFNNKKVQVSTTSASLREAKHKTRHDMPGLEKENPKEFNRQAKTLAVYKMMESANMYNDYSVRSKAVKDAIYSAAWYDVKHPAPDVVFDVSGENDEKELERRASELCEKRLEEINREYARALENMRDNNDPDYNEDMTPFDMFCMRIFAVRVTQKVWKVDYGKNDVSSVLDDMNALDIELQKMEADLTNQNLQNLRNDPQYAEMSKFALQRLAEGRAHYAVARKLIEQGATYRGIEFQKHGVNSSESYVKREDVLLRGRDSRNMSIDQFFEPLSGIGNGTLARFEVSEDPYSTTSEKFGIRLNKSNHPVLVIDGNHRPPYEGRMARNYGSLGSVDNVGNSPQGTKRARHSSGDDVGDDYGGVEVKRQRSSGSDAADCSEEDDEFDDLLDDEAED